MVGSGKGRLQDERDARAPTYAVFRKKFLQAWADVYGSLPSEAAKLTV